jgi:hypothetical protein
MFKFKFSIYSFIFTIFFKFIRKLKFLKIFNFKKLNKKKKFFSKFINLAFKKKFILYLNKIFFSFSNYFL